MTAVAFTLFFFLTSGLLLPQKSGEAVSNAFCPVLTEEKIDPAISTLYKDQRVFFCCNKCQKKFLENPQAYAANLSLFFFALVVPAGCFYLFITYPLQLPWQAQLALAVLFFASLFSAPAIFTRLKLSAAPVEVYRYQGELIYCFYTDVYENARMRGPRPGGLPKSFDFRP